MHRSNDTVVNDAGVFKSLTNLSDKPAPNAASAPAFAPPATVAAATSSSSASSSSSSSLVFGAELRHMELVGTPDGLTVPRFVAECVCCVERPDNLATGGIYRASGKKESIDRLKRKMNKASGGSSANNANYELLQSEDVHTITGALKQFFRELPTALVSSELVERLPRDLGEFFLLLFGVCCAGLFWC